MVNPTAPLSIPELRQHIAKELRRGKSQDDLVRYLGVRGWPEVTARPFVANAAKSVQTSFEVPPKPASLKIQAEASDASLASSYKQRMLRGLLWILAGIGLSFVAYDITRYMQGTGFVFIFAVFFGLVDFVLGLRGWLQHRK